MGIHKSSLIISFAILIFGIVFTGCSSNEQNALPQKSFVASDSVTTEYVSYLRAQHVPLQEEKPKSIVLTAAEKADCGIRYRGIVDNIEFNWLFKKLSYEKITSTYIPIFRQLMAGWADCRPKGRDKAWLTVHQRFVNQLKSSVDRIQR
jgi:hypothetical protein